jgi:iron complex transport system substrate-binding protein
VGLLLLTLAPLLPAELPEVQHADSLSFADRNGQTIVTITNAWEGSPELHYLLQSRDAPDLGDEERYDGIIKVPVRRIASLATPALAHLSDLGALDRIVAVDNGGYVYNREIRQRLAQGTLPEVGSGASFNLERLLTADPELVILSVLGPDDPTVKRLEAVGIPVLPLADWREQSPLGRAEWVALFGALLGMQEEAQALFGPRAARYRELRAETAVIPAQERPTVLTNAPWQGSWPVPAGESYIARLLEAAGGSYLWADRRGTGSIFLDLESVLRRGAEADVWINLNQGWRERSDALDTDPRLAAFEAFRSNRMYHHNRRVRTSGANDFWESGATRPDLVLADLIHILHPNILPDHELVYYRRLEP